MSNRSDLSKKSFITGVSEDVNGFIKSVGEAFNNKGNLRIQHFRVLWSKHKLTYMLLGRRSFRELVELIEHIFRQIRNYAIDDNEPYNKARMAAGLYLLYVLYFKQPVRPRVKIEMTCEQVAKVLSFVDECRAERELELLYCWAALIANNALYYSATDQFYGIEVALAARGGALNGRGEVLNPATSMVASTSSLSNPLQSNSGLSERLNRLKGLSKLNQGLKTALELQANLAVDKLNEDLKRLEDFSITNRGELMSKESEQRRNDENDLGRRRRRLRERAFAEVTNDIRPSASHVSSPQGDQVSVSGSLAEEEMSPTMSTDYDDGIVFTIEEEEQEDNVDDPEWTKNSST